MPNSERENKGGWKVRGAQANGLDQSIGESKCVDAGPRLRDRQPGADAEGAAFDGRCDGGPASVREWESDTVQRSIRWMSRTAVRWAHDSVDPSPVRSPHTSSIRFPFGPRCWMGNRCQVGPKIRSTPRSGIPSHSDQTHQGHCHHCGRMYSGTQRMEWSPVVKLPDLPYCVGLFPCMKI